MRDEPPARAIRLGAAAPAGCAPRSPGGMSEVGARQARSPLQAPPGLRKIAAQRFRPRGPVRVPSARSPSRDGGDQGGFESGFCGSRPYSRSRMASARRVESGRPRMKASECRGRAPTSVIISRPHSAASSMVRPARSAIRRSSSGRKCLIRPWIGQAAASPSAQMVWPSTCLVTSRTCRCLDAGVALAQPLHRPPHPAGALAARRALAAALMLVEIADAADRLHDVGRLVHDDHRRGAEAGAEVLQPVEVHRRVDDLARPAPAAPTIRRGSRRADCPTPPRIPPPWRSMSSRN